MLHQCGLGREMTQKVCHIADLGHSEEYCARQSGWFFDISLTMRIEPVCQCLGFQIVNHEKYIISRLSFIYKIQLAGGSCSNLFGRHTRQVSLQF